MRLIDADSITYESIDSADLLRHEAEHGTGILVVRKEDIDAMHTAESQRIRGKWRHYEGELECDQCGTRFYDEIMDLCGDDVPRFCPNCGADMRGEQNEH